MRPLTIAFVVLVAGAGIALGSDTVPPEIEQPGTQPLDVSSLESPDRCDNCHGGYDQSVEPAFNWRGSMMANAGRDPIFWATVAVAEQDFPGAGDLCLRCHAPAGWLAGRSTPTDGSSLAAGDADGVECDYCHKLVNPDDSEYLGAQFPPYQASQGGVGYYGSGMAVLWEGNEKLGPYSDTVARHQFLPSAFHRSKEFCGTCHDVSNPAVGDLAPTHGTQSGADPVVADGTFGSPAPTKAAFNNFPFQYGVVERTFSEFVAGALSSLPVADYPTLPAEMQTGALQAAYESALVAGTGGDYEDGTTRLFTCQTCHLRPVQGAGCDKRGAPIRADLPLHDMTGGNYWMPEVIAYQDELGQLVLGGGLDTEQRAALEAGAVRALKQLRQAAALSVLGDELRIVNLTGHKLISGYPEGRRMWIHAAWFDASGNLVREDGAYGPVSVTVDGQPTSVDTLFDHEGHSTRVYQAHYGISQAWAAELVDLGYDPGLALAYDRVTGAVTETLGDVAGGPSGSAVETFHFVLNDTVLADNRIPPYGMNSEAARQRNALPVPASQYGNPAADGQYDNVDVVALDPPVTAVWAEISLLYQPTSWEYVQFLLLANDGSSPMLGQEGRNLYDAWRATGMAQPYAMATTTWGSPPVPPDPLVLVDALSTWEVTKQGDLVLPTTTFRPRDTVGVLVEVVDDGNNALSGAQIFAEITVDATGDVVKSLQGFTDTAGEAVLRWKTARQQTPGGYTVTVVDVLVSGYQWNPAGSTTAATFTIE